MASIKITGLMPFQENAIAIDLEKEGYIFDAINDVLIRNKLDTINIEVVEFDESSEPDITIEVGG